MIRVRPNRAGFTLMELMIVIGLIGLLTLISIPAFQSAGRGGKLRTATFQLNTTFSLARQTAITSRQQVYLLFPDDHPPLYNGVAPAHIEKAFRAYAMYGENDGYLAEWRMLPEGVVFDPEIEIGNYHNFYMQQDGNLFLLEDIPFPANEDPAKDIYGVGFRSDGPIHVGGVEDPTVFIAEGWTEYDIDAGTFLDWNYTPDIPLTAIRLNAVTGQSNIQELTR